MSEGGRGGSAIEYQAATVRAGTVEFNGRGLVLEGIDFDAVAGQQRCGGDGKVVSCPKK